MKVKVPNLVLSLFILIFFTIFVKKTLGGGGGGTEKNRCFWAFDSENVL